MRGAGAALEEQPDDGILRAIERRYFGDANGDEKIKTAKERLRLLREAVTETADDIDISGNFSEGLGIAPGRRRIFMGHTDLDGLRGPTINRTTSGEVFCLCHAFSRSKQNADNQQPKSSQVFVTSLEYSRDAFTLPQDVDLKLHSLRDGRFQTRTAFGKLIEATLTHFLAVSSTGISVRERILAFSSLRFSVTSSSPPQNLPSSCGQSSSSAVAAAVLCSLFGAVRFQIDSSSLIESDKAEWLLGKRGGTADMATIVTAKQNEALLLRCVSEQSGSDTERGQSLRLENTSLSFPRSLAILSVTSPIPRLSSEECKPFLRKEAEKSFSTEEDRAAEVEYVCSWAQSQLQHWGSSLFLAAVSFLSQHKIQDHQGEILSTKPHLREPSERCMALCRRTGDLYSVWQSVQESAMTIDDVKDRDTFLIDIVLVLALCIPWEGSGDTRRAFLYAMSELQRGEELKLAVKEIEHLSVFEGGGNEPSPLLSRCIRLNALAHDGDRAWHDVFGKWKREDKAFVENVIESNKDEEASQPAARLVNERGTEQGQPCGEVGKIMNVMYETEWGREWREAYEDSAIVSFVKDRNGVLMRLLERRQLEATDGVSSLAALPGAFERSIKPFDDFADELARAFGDGRVSARVSAAGLGGSMTVFCFQSMVDQVTDFVQLRGWMVDPSSTATAPAPAQSFII